MKSGRERERMEAEAEGGRRERAGERDREREREMCFSQTADHSGSRCSGPMEKREREREEGGGGRGRERDRERERGNNKLSVKRSCTHETERTRERKRGMMSYGLGEENFSVRGRDGTTGPSSDGEIEKEIGRAHV